MGATGREEEGTGVTGGTREDRTHGDNRQLTKDRGPLQTSDIRGGTLTDKDNREGGETSRKSPTEAGFLTSGGVNLGSPQRNTWDVEALSTYLQGTQ